MSIRSKILAPMICVTVACALIIGAMCVYDLNTVVLESHRDAVTRAGDVSKAFIEQEGFLAAHASLSAAQNPEIVEALASYLDGGGRGKLLSAAAHAAQLSNVDFLTILDGKGNVAVRTHEPDKFGDNLSSQTNIKRALQGEQYTTVETGSAVKLSIRSGTPITRDGKLIGVVSMGYRFDQSGFVDRMKKISRTETTVFMGDTRISTTVVNEKGERNVGTKAAEHISKSVLAGNDYVGKATVAGIGMYTIYTPIRDAEGAVVGMLFSGLDTDELNAKVSRMVAVTVGIMLALCGIAAFAALLTANGIAKPIRALSGAAARLALGDMDVSLGVPAERDSKDETRQLAASFAGLIDANRAQERFVGFVARGDLTHQVHQRGDNDTLSHALRDMIDSTKKQAGVMERIAEGDLRDDVAPRCDQDSLSQALRKTLANLNYTMGEIRSAASRLAGASAEISSGAQGLSESANEQASSLEEISASLEEISSMTKQNADSSNQGKQLVASVAESLGEADVAMKRMGEAISHIKASSGNTAKILRTIDDIAFQTNLLALNAAVEAARAGEAGKGFAVVAEEVRNLAMRSAEASKNTAGMVEESVKSADEGALITEDVARYLSLTIERAGKVGEIIAEIAAANGEQALGIEQVNSAVAQMNSATQRNAANSEESAGAAEELSGQATELDDLVSRFKLKEGRDD